LIYICVGKYEEAAGYDFIPTTFLLPREYSMFVEKFKEVGGVWIMKPTGSAQGKGDDDDSDCDDDDEDDDDDDNDSDSSFRMMMKMVMLLLLLMMMEIR